MSGPRATAKQAIEILKIHQIRKENVFINDQIQVLREEVTNLSRKQDEARSIDARSQEGCEELKRKMTTYDEALKQVEKAVELTTRDTSDLRGILNALKDKMKLKEAAYDEDRARVQAKVEMLTEEVEQSRAADHDGIQAVMEKINGLHETVEAVIDDTRMTALEQRMQQLEDDIRSSEAHGDKSMSRLHDSVQEQNIRVSDANSQYFSVPTLSSVLHYQPRDDMNSTQPLEPNVSPFVINELELDPNHSENIDSILQTSEDQGVPDQITKDKLNQPKKDISIAEVLLALKQGNKGLNEYVVKTELLRDVLSIDLEPVLLNRFINGLSAEERQPIVRKWLDTSSWTWKNAKQCAALLDIPFRHGQYQSSQLESTPESTRNSQTTDVTRSRMKPIAISSDGQSGERSDNPSSTSSHDIHLSSPVLADGFYSEHDSNQPTSGNEDYSLSNKHGNKETSVSSAEMSQEFEARQLRPRDQYGKVKTAEVKSMSKSTMHNQRKRSQEPSESESAIPPCDISTGESIVQPVTKKRKVRRVYGRIMHGKRRQQRQPLASNSTTVSTVPVSGDRFDRWDSPTT